jgi:hypothetical protein
MSWMASDVIRLVTSNPEKNLDHRLPEGKLGAIYLLIGFSYENI